ncbi:uncharacterized protein [Struthio camelus]|uniref:uncharacterized protein n=1 Tax=Struthio camelus TaxID=8801 RepID=UPI003603B2E8
MGRKRCLRAGGRSRFPPARRPAASAAALGEAGRGLGAAAAAALALLTPSATCASVPAAREAVGQPEPNVTGRQTSKIQRLRIQTPERSQRKGGFLSSSPPLSAASQALGISVTLSLCRQNFLASHAIKNRSAVFALPKTACATKTRQRRYFPQLPKSSSIKKALANDRPSNEAAAPLCVRPRCSAQKRCSFPFAQLLRLPQAAGLPRLLAGLRTHTLGMAPAA